MKSSNHSLIVQSIPLDKLKKCDENVRKVPHDKEEIEALANSIEAHGQIQNLVVKSERDGEGNATGDYLVIAGEGRRLAQLLRVKHRKIKADHPIACLIDDSHSATAVSLAENDLRRPSHPVDQLSAFKVLTDAGFGPGYKTPGLPHRTGHGIGLDVHEWPYLVGSDETPLDVGMCFSNEPMICIPGEFGIRHEDHFYMTEKGARWFTQPAHTVDDPFGLQK